MPQLPTRLCTCRRCTQCTIHRLALNTQFGTCSWSRPCSPTASQNSPDRHHMSQLPTCLCTCRRCMRCTIHHRAPSTRGCTCSPSRPCSPEGTRNLPDNHHSLMHGSCPLCPRTCPQYNSGTCPRKWPWCSESTCLGRTPHNPSQHRCPSTQGISLLRSPRTQSNSRRASTCLC